MDEKEISIENRLKDFRKKNKLSQEELADELGISRQSIISLEQGRTMPSLPLAVSLCKFFDAAFEDIFEFEREVEKHIENVFPSDQNRSLTLNNFDLTERQGSRKESTMIELEPWRPFRETVSLRDAMDRLLEDSFITPAKMAGGLPKIDIKDKKDSILVRAEIPGVDEEDVNIEILDNVMTISGEKKAEREEKDENPPAGGGYYYKESHTGSFSRSFTLPGDVVADDAHADVKNGILTVTIPKVEPKKAKKIEVKKK